MYISNKFPGDANAAGAGLLVGRGGEVTALWPPQASFPGAGLIPSRSLLLPSLGSHHCVLPRRTLSELGPAAGRLLGSQDQQNNWVRRRPLHCHTAALQTLLHSLSLSIRTQPHLSTSSTHSSPSSAATSVRGLAWPAEHGQ